MSMTLESSPALIGMTQNNMIWAFSTDTDPAPVLSIQVLIETAPYTDEWHFVGEFHQPPGADGLAQFNLSRILRDWLQHNPPNFFEVAAGIAPDVCRRYKLRYAEGVHVARTHLGTYYQATGSAAYKALNFDFSSSSSYILVAESVDTAQLDSIVKIDSTTPVDLQGWALEIQRSVLYFNPVSNYTDKDIQLPSGVAITIYESTAPWSSYTDVRSVLLGGIQVDRATLPALPPDAPTLLTATAMGEDQVDLTLVDQSGGLAHHQIWVSQTGEFGEYILLDTWDPGDSSGSHTDASPGTQYWYKALAVLSGSSSQEFSNVATATTLDLSNAFKITVKTDNTGTSEDDEFTLPITDSVATTELDVYLVSDGSLLGTASSVSPTITFPAGAGTYDIAVTGTMGGWAFNNGGDKLKITKIDNWGIFNHGDEEGAFYGCTNLTLLTTSDTPDLSGSTTLRNFFRNCTSITTINNIDTWDVSTIENFTIMFFGITSLNVSLSTWDVGSGRLFGNMFQSTPFNGDISGWDMSSATNISSMFNLATSFNQDISGWDVSSVTSFASMFQNATSFDQDLSGWDVSAATTFGNMFTNASAFDQDLSDWDVHLAAGRAGGVPTMTNFLSNAGMSTANYDLLLNAWDAVDLVDGVSFGAQGINYTTATSGTARTNIISNDSWTITDAGGV